MEVVPFTIVANSVRHMKLDYDNRLRRHFGHEHLDHPERRARNAWEEAANHLEAIFSPAGLVSSIIQI
jgi:hypothetical protein